VDLESAIQSGAAIVGLGMLFLPVIQIVEQLAHHQDSYINPHDRIKVLDSKNKKIFLWAGELEPGFYREFMAKFYESKVQELEIIFGPDLMIWSDYYSRYLELKKSGRLPSENEWLRWNPVLAAVANPSTKGKKVALYCRLMPSDEPHHSIGSSLFRRDVCEEYRHPKGHPLGGKFYRRDTVTHSVKKGNFEAWRADPAKTVLLTAQNAGQIYPTLQFLDAMVKEVAA